MLKEYLFQVMLSTQMMCQMKAVNQHSPAVQALSFYELTSNNVDKTLFQGPVSRKHR
jgi:hypothetical protein